MHTFKDLFEFLQNYDNNVSIVHWLKKRWDGKDKQESLLRLFSGLGLIDKLNQYDICNGNFNEKTIKKNETIRDVFYDSNNNLLYLKDKGDSSDLTGIHKNDKTNLLVTTSKNLNKTNVGKLDIDKILSNFQQYKDNYTMSLCVCIRNINDFKLMKKGIEKTNTYLKTLLEKKSTIIIDWNDLVQAYYQFKMHFKNISIDSILNSNKPTLCLKMHQHLSVLKTLTLKNNGKKEILWGHIQRSGKSYIIGGSIIEDSKGKENCNYLIITTAPNETIEQQKNVFHCIQLCDFNIVVLNGKNKKPKLSKKNIVLCSKQFLQTKIENPKKGKPAEKTKSIAWLKKMIFDMRFIDESHNGATTELAKKTLDYYGKHSFTVQITATYSKPINDYNIPKCCWILWDLEDIKLCKNITNKNNKNRLIEKHGNDIKDVLNKYSPDNIIKEYSKYPELWLLTDEINETVLSTIIDQTQNNNYGWSTQACFALKEGVIQNPVTNKNEIILKEEFQNEKENLKLWYKIFGKKNEFGIPDNIYPDSIVFMKRIEKICKNPTVDSRFIGEGEFYNEPMIIMAFLPQKNIHKLSQATMNLLKKYNVIPNYEILCINSKTTNNPKQSIENARTRAKNSNKKGVLVLSGKQCSLGVSINNCDIVLLLNSNMSYDMIYQMMFRCMTEGKYKKCGFVIDLNIHRVIETSIINYASLIKPNLHPRESTKFILQERLINLNGDHWSPCFGHLKSQLNNLCNNIYEIYSSNTEKALDHFLNRLKFKEIMLTKDEQQLVNIMFSKSKPSKRQLQIVDDMLEEEEKEQVKKGIEKIQTDITNSSDSSDESIEPEEEEPAINFMDILKHVIPLVCLLTIHNDKTSFVDMFTYIENNEYVYNILLNQVKSWWGNSINVNIIKKFINIYIKYMKNDSETNQIIRTVKEIFMKNIKNRRELSILIDKYLIPQELEKKSNAEVSTPYTLRQKMLDTIPIDFWKSIKKVFEPCAGKGGIIIDIIDRFMNGLKDLIPDEKERYKTIVEKCLYFADINTTNIFICKLLIDPDNIYSLNYNVGNTLEIDIKDKFNLEYFDAIIGNPPYQPPSNNKKGGKSAWPDFVKYSLSILNEKGYLLFVHPALWRKAENKLRKIMFNKQIIYLSIHNKVEGKKVFGATTRYDYYLMENTIPYKKTKVYFEDKKTYEITINDNLPFIPNFGWSVFEKILKKLNNNGMKVCRDSDCHSSRPHVSKTREEGYNYKLLNSISKTKGKTYRYSSKQHKCQTCKKVIFSNGETIVPFYDDGELGVTEGGLYLLVEKEDIGHKIVDYLNTNIIKFIIKSTKWSNFETNKEIFWYIPNIVNVIEGDITDEKVYKYFEITKQEVEAIEN